MSYTCRLNEDLTVTYAGSDVCIRYTEHYWDKVPDQYVNIPSDKIDMLIAALNDIKNIRSREW